MENGQRFCVNCGAPAPNVPRPEQKPAMDLSPYFDEPAPETVKWDQAQNNQSYVPPIQPQRGPVRQEAPAPTPRRSDRGLNIALMICAVLAVAVVTVLVLMLISGRRNNQNAGYPGDSALPVTTETPQNIIIPENSSGSAATEIVTPAPLTPEASSLPIVTQPPTLPPTPAPTPTPTPTPTPAPTSVLDADYILPESNTRLLTEADLSKLTHEQLCLARNEIFARHGRIFKTPQIAAYFNSKSWYKGTIAPENFNEKVLNQYEWANISFIRDYENAHYGGSYY